ncbi:hypothetical protein BC629DRAFT_851185 [Irpex lacteus]|nr:hypothetical protein BC629DRAFT_851185 [Irpex lacteus]
MSSRSASHADSWYTGNRQRLDSELTRNLAAVEASDEFVPPVRGCKAIIAPILLFWPRGSLGIQEY